MGPDNKPVIVSEHLPNAHMRLFGGAQYHRAMAEFRAGARRCAAGRLVVSSSGNSMAAWLVRVFQLRDGAQMLSSFVAL